MLIGYYVYSRSSNSSICLVLDRCQTFFLMEKGKDSLPYAHHTYITHIFWMFSVFSITAYISELYRNVPSFWEQWERRQYMEPNTSLLNFQEQMESPHQGKPPTSFCKKDSVILFVPNEIQRSCPPRPHCLALQALCCALHLPEIPPLTSLESRVRLGICTPGPLPWQPPGWFRWLPQPSREYQSWHLTPCPGIVWTVFLCYQTAAFFKIRVVLCCLLSSEPSSTYSTNQQVYP